MRNKRLLGLCVQLSAQLFAQQLAQRPYAVGILAPGWEVGKAESVKRSASGKIAASCSSAVTRDILTPVKNRGEQSFIYMAKCDFSCRRSLTRKLVLLHNWLFLKIFFCESVRQIFLSARMEM
jgi:hypothetical protein